MARASVFPAARLAWLGVLVVLAGCQTPIRAGSDYDRAASFSSFRNFTIMQREHRQITNPLAVQRTQDAIRRNLQSRGFNYVSDPAQADFTVDFTLGARERTDITTYPAPWGPGWYGGPGWWGRPYWGNSIDVRQFQEGTLSVDVFDDRSRRPVWHGWARKRLSQNDIERSEPLINEAVARVLEEFPPGRGGSS